MVDQLSPDERFALLKKFELTVPPLESSAFVDPFAWRDPRNLQRAHKMYRDEAGEGEAVFESQVDDEAEMKLVDEEFKSDAMDEVWKFVNKTTSLDNFVFILWKAGAVEPGLILPPETAMNENIAPEDYEALLSDKKTCIMWFPKNKKARHARKSCYAKDAIICRLDDFDDDGLVQRARTSKVEGVRHCIAVADECFRKASTRLELVESESEDMAVE